MLDIETEHKMCPHHRVLPMILLLVVRYQGMVTMLIDMYIEDQLNLVIL
jgi:hypothetical protein